jgi:hypothetical protein
MIHRIPRLFINHIQTHEQESVANLVAGLVTSSVASSGVISEEDPQSDVDFEGDDELPLVEIVSHDLRTVASLTDPRGLFEEIAGQRHI